MDLLTAQAWNRYTHLEKHSLFLVSVELLLPSLPKGLERVKAQVFWAPKERAAGNGLSHTNQLILPWRGASKEAEGNKES